MLAKKFCKLVFYLINQLLKYTKSLHIYAIKNAITKFNACIQIFTFILVKPGLKLEYHDKYKDKELMNMKVVSIVSAIANNLCKNGLS